MPFRWNRVRAVVGIQPLLGLFVAVMWLTILLVVPESEPWHKNGRTHHHRKSPRYPLPIKYTFSDTQGAPHVAVYEPASLDSEEAYEADLAVPSDYAQRLFSEAYGFFLSSMEDRYGVSASVVPGGDGGRSPDDEVFATLRVKGPRLSVECFRAKLRSSVHTADMSKMTYRYYDEFGESMALSVPEDMLAVFRADGGARIERFERLAGAKVQISEEPDPEDPTARLVTLSGEAYGAAAERTRGLDALQKELVTAFDSLTPGVWRTVSTKIDPEKVMFVIGEDGSIINDLVRRSGCRIQFGPVETRSYPARQKVLITGPGDAPKEARREIRSLVKEGELAMSRQVYGSVAAQKNYEELMVAQQHYEEDFKMAEHDHKDWELDEDQSGELEGA